MNLFFSKHPAEGTYFQHEVTRFYLIRFHHRGPFSKRKGIPWPHRIYVSPDGLWVGKFILKRFVPFSEIRTTTPVGGGLLGLGAQFTTNGGKTYYLRFLRGNQKTEFFRLLARHGRHSGTISGAI